MLHLILRRILLRDCIANTILRMRASTPPLVYRNISNYNILVLILIGTNDLALEE